MSAEPGKNHEHTQTPPTKPSIKQLIISTLGAAIGVQSEQVRQNDFQQTSAIPYIICGVVFTLVFMLSLIWVVSLVIGE